MAGPVALPPADQRESTARRRLEDGAAAPDSLRKTVAPPVQLINKVPIIRRIKHK